MKTLGCFHTFLFDPGASPEEFFRLNEGERNTENGERKAKKNGIIIIGIFLFWFELDYRA